MKKSNKVTCVDGTITVEIGDAFYGSHDEDYRDKLALDIEPIVDDFIKKLSRITEVIDYQTDLSYTFTYDDEF